MKLKHLSIAVALAAVSAPSFAGAPNFIDARAAAMGGVGVVTARPRAASFFNPALLAVKQPEKSDSFGMLTPSLMAFADDEDELVDTIDAFEDDFVDPFEAAIDAMEAVPSPGNAAEIVTRATALNEELGRINNDQATVDIGAGISFAIPSRTFAVGLFTSASARINLSLQYRDEQLLEDIILDAENDVVPVYNEGDLQSSVRAIGAGTSQAGISLATSFELGGYDIAVGLSPKIVDFRAYDYAADVDDFEEDDLEDTEISDKGTNFDIGAAMYLDDTKNWLLGLSVQNLQSRKITTPGSVISASTNNPAILVPGITLELQPTIMTGISYSTENFVVAADLQLNETDGFHTVDDTQMAGLGMEYDIGEMLQLRAGVRHNLAGSGDPVFTAGLGLDLWGATIEVAGMGNSTAMGAAIQIGAMF